MFCLFLEYVTLKFNVMVVQDTLPFCLDCPPYVRYAH